MIVQMSRKSKIYHRAGCRYLGRIDEEALAALDMDDEKIKNYRPCKYCCSLKNIYKNLKPELREMFVDFNIEVEAGESFLLVNTPSYHWRVDFQASNQMVKLYTGDLDEELQEYTWIRWSECESTRNLQSVMKSILNEEKLADYPSPYRKYAFQIDQYAEAHNIQMEYDGTDLYVLTDMAAWKMAYVNRYDCFKLLHCPFDGKALTMEEAKTAHYHVQADVSGKQSPYKHIQYIAKHDEAKKIEQVDYKKLPQRTKKQKKYYRQAENRAKRKSVRRVLDLFAELESKKEFHQFADFI